MAYYFFYHGAHLVYFYGVNYEMFCIEIVFFRCFLETRGGFFNPVVKNVGKPQQHRGGYVPGLEFAHHFFQIDLFAVFSRSYINVSFFVYVEVANAPAVYVVEFG